MRDHTDKTILVIGATGLQGSAVTRHLLKDGWKIRALVRDPDNEKAQALEKQGVELMKGDLNDRASLESALKGAYGMYGVTNYWRPDVGKEGEVRHGKNLADAAKASGVKHFVFSSVGAAQRGMGQEHFATKWEIEQYIHKLGVPFTILRPVAFMENYNRMRNSLLNGTFISRGIPAGKTVQIVAVDDIGAFAAMAFDRPKEFLGKTIELAGDELTEAQIVATFAKVIGRPVTLGSPQGAAGPFSEAERAAMTRFFNGQGYDADIPALRKQYPQLKKLETFLRENGWENAQPTPETTKAW